MTLYWISLDVSVLVVKRVHVLFTFLSIYVRVVASNAHCVVFLLCLFSSCSVPCVASFSGLSFYDCSYCISLMFITPPVVYLFVIFCFVHLRFGFFIWFVLFCFIFRFVFYFVCFVLFYRMCIQANFKNTRYL